MQAECSEDNYPTHKREFLALRWAITDKFHDDLYGHSFAVYTDNNPLTNVLTSVSLQTTSASSIDQEKQILMQMFYLDCPDLQLRILLMKDRRSKSILSEL